MKNASWALSNLCRGRPTPEFSLIKKAIIYLAKILVENDREDILFDVCWSFSYITDKG
jgi:importin subunit alpha-6/7